MVPSRESIAIAIAIAVYHTFISFSLLSERENAIEMVPCYMLPHVTILSDYFAPHTPLLKECSAALLALV